MAESSTPTGITHRRSWTSLLPERLRLPLWLCLPVACWVVLGVAMGEQLFPALATDDYPRLVLSMQWARTPFFAPIDRYWLPLPYWIYGPWYAMAGRWLGLYAHLPLSGGLVGLSVALLMALCRVLLAGGPQPNSARVPKALWLAFALPFTIPILYYIATSGLSETVYLPTLALVAFTLMRFVDRPGRGRGLWLLAAAILLQTSRYEGWPLSYVAVGLAQLMTWRKTSSTPRQWAGWVLVYGALFIVPAAWMALNYQAYGSPLHFLAQADEGARLDAALNTLGTGYRLKFLLRHAIGQGWLILALAPAALPMMRRDARAMALGLFAAAAWALYFEAAVGNTVGVARSERFCLGPLFLTLPLAVMGANWLREHMRGWPLRGLAIVVILFSILMLNQGFHRLLAKPLVDESTYHRLLELRELARTDRMVVVIGDPAHFGQPDANIFRFYLGLDAVAMLDWYSPEWPVDGLFMYYPSTTERTGQPDGHLLGRPYLMLRRMPPATSPAEP